LYYFVGLGTQYSYNIYNIQCGAKNATHVIFSNFIIVWCQNFLGISLSKIILYIWLIFDITVCKK